MITYHVVVNTVCGGYPVQEVGGKLASWEGSQHMNPFDMKAKNKRTDRLKELVKENGARVSVGLEEKRSGPPNTYSSVTISVQISASCEQSAAAVKELKELLYTECSNAIDHYSDPAMKLLVSHLEAGG